LQAYAQGSTSKGTEFWTAFMANTNPPGTATGSQMVLYVTSDVSTTVTVSIGSGANGLQYAVTANQITTIPIDPGVYLKAAGKYNLGIHITSLKPIAVYAHIYAQESSGAALLLPVNSLGKDYQSINYAQTSDISPSYSAFLVIATEDNTTVELTEKTITLNGAIAQKIDTVNLMKGDVYQVLSANDLTGSRIRSISNGTNACKKIAVFSGSTRILIGCNLVGNSSDNLFQQAFPTATWGETYITVPLKGRDYDVFRVVLSDPNTNLQVGGAAISGSSIVAGSFYEFKTRQPTFITADKPIQVVQYAVTQGNTIDCKVDSTDVGDPEMIFLNPVEQTLDHITVFSASKYQILNDYINVVIPTTGVASFLLDGVHPGAFNVLPNHEDYCFGQIHVQPGPHVLSANEGFDAIAYGFGEFESYGYSAGASLQDLSTYIVLQNPQTNVVQQSGCAGVGYNLQLALPYKTSSIKWDFGDGNPITQANPVVAGTIVNGTQTLYQYYYPKDPVSFVAGNYTVIATVFDPVVDECGSMQQVELDFGISDTPVANFKVDVNPNPGTAFIDESTSSVDIKSWLWDFGDGQTAVDENPVHTYAKPGKYNVALTVTDADGCSSAHSELITVNITATAADGSIAACKGQAAVAPYIQQFSILGNFLSADITVTAPPDFEVSFNQGNGYAGSLTISQTAGAVNNTIVYVRSVAGAPVGNVAGNVLVASAGVTGVNVAVAGIINDLPSMNQVSDQTFTNGTPSTAIIFGGASNTFSWTNDTPAIGLPASGQGNISSFTPVNGGKSPLIANIVVTPLSSTEAYIANANYGNVSVINTVTNVITASITVGTYPQGVAAAPDGSRVYITNGRDGTISVIDAHTNTLVVPDIKTQPDPFGVCVSPDGNWVYVTSTSGSDVVIMNSATFAQTLVKVQSKPTGIAISPDGSTLYVSNSGANLVSVINVITRTVSYSIPTGTTPDGLLLSPDGSKLYVVNTGSASISIFNTLTLALMSTVKVGAQPFGITQNADGSRLYVTNSQSNTVSVIDGNAFNIIATVPVGTVPFGISVSPDGSTIYVTNQTSNDVSVIDTKTNQELYRFDSNPGPTSFGNFIITGTGCAGPPVHFTITVLPTPNAPGIAYTDVPGPMSTVYGAQSPSTNFTVTGENLSAGILVAAPKDFEVSADNRTFGSSITIDPGTVVYVRLTNHIAVDGYSGNIELSSPHATNVTVPVTGTVTPAPLTIVADNKTKVYLAAIPPLTVSYQGLVNDDGPAAMTIKPQVTTIATVNSPVGEYPITAIGAVSPNYTIGYMPGTLTITIVLPPLSIPNVFTPNGDGINDTWDIKYIEDYPTATVTIFSRYGEKLYSSIGYATPWDGRYHGALLPAGTYYYIIDFKQDNSKLLSGFVTIIR